MRGRHVYLSYAPEDSKEAAEIARELEQRDIAVRLDRADVAWGESWAAHVSGAVETLSTSLVMVVSRIPPVMSMTGKKPRPH